MASDYKLAVGEVLDEFRDVYGLVITPVLVESYVNALSACTAEEITHAAVEHLKGSKFSPRPAELLAIVVSERSKQVKQEQSQEFWQKAREAEQTKFKGAFKRPEGVTVLDHIDALMAQGMTREQAVNEVCQ